MERSLKELLERLPIPGLKESADRHSIAELLTDELHIPIRARQIILKDGILTVSVPSVVKAALQVRSSMLIAHAAQQGITIRSIR